MVLLPEGAEAAGTRQPEERQAPSLAETPCKRRKGPLLFLFACASELLRSTFAAEAPTHRAQLL